MIERFNETKVSKKRYFIYTTNYQKLTIFRYSFRYFQSLLSSTKIYYYFLYSKIIYLLKDKIKNGFYQLKESQLSSLTTGYILIIY